jgi:hypothetical protein
MQNKEKEHETPRNEETAVERGGQETRIKEIGGPAGPEPTRYGDWERRGRCIDF